MALRSMADFTSAADAGAHVDLLESMGAAYRHRGQGGAQGEGNLFSKPSMSDFWTSEFEPKFRRRQRQVAPSTPNSEKKKTHGAGGHPEGDGIQSSAGLGRHDLQKRSLSALEGQKRQRKEHLRQQHNSILGKRQSSSGSSSKLPSNDQLLGLVRPRNEVERRPQVEEAVLEQAQNKRKTPQASPMAQAIQLVKAPQFNQVVGKFQKHFFAESSRKARECKREVVAELARAVKGSRNFLPLDKLTVEGTSAAMKEVGMKSGQQYLAELRLMHVEAGFEVPAWLRRTFDLCKKGLEREKGPTKRAAAIRVEDTLWERLDTKVHKKGWPLRPARAFLWASIWMLREIELRNMRTKHVNMDTENGVVTLTLPLSKCDQQGEGVRRTLGCCRMKPCHCRCPLRLAKLLQSERRKQDMFGRDWAFPSNER